MIMIITIIIIIIIIMLSVTQRSVIVITQTSHLGASKIPSPPGPFEREA